MEGSIIVRGRVRLRKAMDEIIKKDLNLIDLPNDMVYNRTQWHHLIHIAKST